MFTVKDLFTPASIFAHCVVAVVIIFAVSLVEVKLSHFAAALFSCAFLYYSYFIRKSDLTTFNREMEVKLLEVLEQTESIKGNVKLLYKPKFLWQEPDMICLLHESIPFKEHNDSAFLDTVENIDKLYIVYNDLITTNANRVQAEQLVSVAKKHADLAERHYKSFEISIPSEKHTRKKFLVCLGRIRLLLARKMDEMYRISNKKNAEGLVGNQRRPLQRTKFGAGPVGYSGDTFTVDGLLD